MKKVYVILLNWNNWTDTLECLESLWRMDHAEFRVVVCDNGSTDDSLRKIREWAADRREGNLQPHLPIASSLCVPKPCAIAELDRFSAESGGNEEADAARLILIRNGVNLGFAGGNNVGLRFALSRPDFGYAWLLNNDTVVAPDALRHLIDRMSEDDAPGMCGSSILEYRRPEKVNALGGAIYSRWFGLAWHLGRGRNWPIGTSGRRIERRMDYVVGASMFVSPDFLKAVGLMEESYFLYFEEIDWALRGRRRFNLAWAPQSRVYHKIGASIGTSSHPARKSWTSDFYTLRNRIWFTRRYWPWALPTVYFGMLGAFCLRLMFGEWRKAIMVLRLMVNPSRPFEDCRQP